jgi:NAD-dependent DNA ligase
MTNDEDIVKAKINYSRAMAGERHITIEEFGELNREYYETRYNPIFNYRNEIIGATAFSSNITERRRLIKGLEDTEKSLQKKIEELEWLNQMMIGREIRMIELKKEINTLLKKLGKEEKYIIHGSEQELNNFR